MYDFDPIIDRSNTQAYKLELRKQNFGYDDVLPLWVADMDFAAPTAVQKVIQERARHPIYGYTVRTPHFKESIGRWLLERHCWSVSTDSIEYSPGVVPALAFSILALTAPGDGIIVQTPVYPPFYSVVKQNHRSLQINPLLRNVNGQYEMDFDHFESLAKLPENKLFILCHPHNPIGQEWSKEDLFRLGEICVRNDVLVLSDEIHSDVVLWGKKHVPFASIHPEFAQISITMMAPSKSFNIAGMNTSYIVAPNEVLMHKYQVQQQALHLNLSHTFGAMALEAAYDYGSGWLNEMLIYIGDNVLFVQDYLNHHLPMVKLQRPDATYLLWLDFSELQLSQSDLRKLIYENARVGLNDGVSFGSNGEGFMRMNVASPQIMVQEGLQRIARAIYA